MIFSALAICGTTGCAASAARFSPYSFTAVDAFFAPVAFRILSYGLRIDGAAAGYAARLLELPAMQEWYASALAEPWREPDHEMEVSAAGILTEDLRASA